MSGARAVQGEHCAEYQLALRGTPDTCDAWSRAAFRAVLLPRSRLLTAPEEQVEVAAEDEVQNYGAPSAISRMLKWSPRGSISSRRVAGRRVDEAATGRNHSGRDAHCWPGRRGGGTRVADFGRHARTRRFIGYRAFPSSRPSGEGRRSRLPSAGSDAADPPPLQGTRVRCARGRLSLAAFAIGPWLRPSQAGSSS